MFGKEKIFILLLLLPGALIAESLKLQDAVFVAFDTETTGFCCEKDRVLEIGAVRFRGDGSVLAVTNWLINPQSDISEFATEVHGITAEMVADAPAFATVWPEFEAFCAEAVWLAHNARFDIAFLQSELERAGMDVPEFKVVDTLIVFKRWFPDASGYSLEMLNTWLGLNSGLHHRADADSLAIVRIFNEGIKRLDGVELYAEDYLKR